MTAPTLLVSGATGFLGTSIVATAARPVVAVLRGADFEQRADVLARRTGAEVAGVRGDVTRPLWGLGDRLDGLRGRVGAVVSAAAITDWADTGPRLTAVNTLGARHAVDVAAALGVPLVHVSSLYACYRPDGVVPEALTTETAWLSKYERSKCRGEWAAADEAERRGVPLVIARVGALAGDLHPPPGERRSSHRVPFARLFRNFGTSFVPYAPRARLDVTPRDVAAAMVLACLAAADGGVEVRNLGLGFASPTVHAVLEEAADVAEPAEWSFRPRRVPRSVLLGLSGTADRFGRGARAATVIGLRYLASAAQYDGAGPPVPLPLAELVRTLGFERPVATAPSVGSGYYAGWEG